MLRFASTEDIRTTVITTSEQVLEHSFLGLIKNDASRLKFGLLGGISPFQSISDIR
jgi:hypothetical protein